MSEEKKKKRSKRNYKWGQLGLELLVVFLGISIAFLLNNWREAKKEAELEFKYIKSFEKDVEDNIIELEKLIEIDSLWLADAKPWLIEIRNKTITEDSANVVIRGIIQINKMDYHLGTYEDISNSGNLKLISDFDLKTKIVDYHLTLEGGIFLDNHFYKYFNDQVMPYVFNEYDILNGEFVSSTAYQSVQFSNVYVGYFSMVQQRNIFYKELLIKSNAYNKELLNWFDLAL